MCQALGWGESSEHHPSAEGENKDVGAERSASNSPFPGGPGVCRVSVLGLE